MKKIAALYAATVATLVALTLAGGAELANGWPVG